MEFKSLKNIETSFRQIRLFSMVFLALCAVVTVWSVWSSYRFAEKQREKIYVLDNGKSLMLALCLFNFHAEYIMRNTGLEETQAGIKIARRNINNLAMQMTPPLWQKVKRN